MVSSFFYLECDYVVILVLYLQCYLCCLCSGTCVVGCRLLVHRSVMVTDSRDQYCRRGGKRSKDAPLGPLPERTGDGGGSWMYQEMQVWLEMMGY